MEVEMAEQIWQEPTESENTGPWLADNQSRDLNNELWFVAGSGMMGTTYPFSDFTPKTWYLRILLVDFCIEITLAVLDCL